MSAALTLPYVWATTSEAGVRSESRAYPIGGIAFYRRRTENLLRRYMRASLATGRVPSLWGDTTLRGRASNSKRKNFEDIVIFTIDVEKCLKRLDPQALQIVVKIAIQEHLFLEAAEQMGLDCRTIGRRYGAAIDCLTEEFLKRKLLEDDGRNYCQE